MKIRIVFASILALACFAACQAAPTPRHVSPATMDKNTQELFKSSMDLNDQAFDASAKLLRNPLSRRTGTMGPYHMVRESSWYALGLLTRDAPGDRQRAADLIDAVLKQQYLTPGVRWYGTFHRAPEEPDPVPDAVMWRNYDPNWRVFIGTTFAMILIEYPDRIPATLAQRMYTSIDHAIEGEIAEKRLVPSYTNIAVMYGFLWDFAAQHGNRADWRQMSHDWTESVYKLYSQYGTFYEYNSPTYCGVDLYGLALWRAYGSTERIRKAGSEMESGLWNDLADHYQPDLRNIAGPYDRSYGMDMESYVSVVGVWMRSVLDAQHAPLPAITPSTDHVPDVWFASQIAILGAKIPAAALAKIHSFAGEHLVRKQISDQRVATTFVGNHVIFGGEATSKTKDEGPASQFHAATIQWRTPSGEIGFAYITQAPMIDATADKNGLSISATGTVRWHIHASGLTPEKLTATDWDLPGLHVSVKAGQKDFSIEKSPTGVDLVYSGITGVRLEIKPAQ